MGADLEVVALQQLTAALEVGVAVVDLDDDRPDAGPVVLADALEDVELSSLDGDLQEVDPRHGEAVEQLGEGRKSRPRRSGSRPR